MSIRGFHIIFITIATLLCILVALWAFLVVDAPTLGIKVFGATCAVATLVLPAYGVSFYRKAQKI